MRKFIAILLIVVALLAMTSCGNMDMFDTTYTYDRAIVQLPNGEVVEGKVETWTDYDSSDQVMVQINGVKYFTHSINVVFIAD